MGITSRNLTTVLFFFFNALSPGQTDSQVDASPRKFTTCVRLAFRLATHLRGLASRLATLRKPVRKFWFCKLVLTCVDLRVRLARALHVLAWFPHFKRMKFKLLFKGGLYSVANLLIWGFEMLYCILLIDDKVYFTPPPIFNDFIRDTIIRCEGYKQALNILIQRQ